MLHARVAALDKSKAALTLAQIEFERARQLLPTSATTREEFDRRQATLSIAHAGVTQALSDVYQIRVSLGLAAQPETGGDLGQVPPDLDQTYSSVLQAQADLIHGGPRMTAG